MPNRDPANKKFRVAIYLIYAVLISWIILAFGIGAARGVFSSAGKDRLAARRVALLVCTAAASSDPPIRIDSCPSGTGTGNPAVLIREAREAAAGMSDREKAAGANDLINSLEVIVSGKLGRSNVPRLVEGPIGEYLN